MDDAGRTCLAAAGIAAVTLLIFLLTAAECCIIECSENEAKKLLQEQGSKRAGRLLDLKGRRQDVRVTGVAGRNILMAVLMTILAREFYPTLRDALGGVITSGFGAAAVSIIILIIIEALIITLSVNLARRLAAFDVIGLGFAMKLCGVYRAAMVLLFPFTAAADGLTGLFLRSFGVKDADGQEPVSEEEILMLVDAGNDSGDIDETQAEMISNIFEFDDLEAKDVMTHRIDITGTERSNSIDAVIELAISEGFSRIPVYDGNIDNICGVIYIKDLLGLLHGGYDKRTTAGDVCREIRFFPESIGCGELFEEMTGSKTQIAALVDEYGGTAGIVTIEDLIEEIVGSIDDEYDETAPGEIIRLGQGSYDVSGLARPSDVTQALEIDKEIPDEFDTIGGFVIDLLGFIPSRTQKPTIKWNGLKFTVLKADETKIEKLRIKKLSPALA